MADDAGTAELKLAVRRFAEAWASGDVEALAALLSPTYTHTDVFGGLSSRADWLAYAAGRAGRSTQIAFRSVQTRRIGDTAIVTGINDVTGGGARNPGDQKPLSLRFTQVWMLRDGRWLREAFQGTPIGTEQGS
jgi:ketosteroid isomerase-like protein